MGMLDVHKLSQRLAERLGSLDPSDDIEVIVEMAWQEPQLLGSRQEQLAALRARFDREASTVVAKIAQAGGRVLDCGWLNQTVVAVISAGMVASIAEDEAVRSIDLPEALELA